MSDVGFFFLVLLLSASFTGILVVGFIIMQTNKTLSWAAEEPRSKEKVNEHFGEVLRGLVVFGGGSLIGCMALFWAVMIGEPFTMFITFVACMVVLVLAMGKLFSKAATLIPQTPAPPSVEKAAPSLPEVTQGSVGATTSVAIPLRIETNQ